ncbi:MAG: single-stranded-DNA-specific exonuclease RecJ [Bacteroidota bacterium]
MEKQWRFRNLPDADTVNLLANTLGIDPVIATLLLQKGIHTFDQAKAYFRPTLTDLYDPFCMMGMESAIYRLKKAIQQGQPILIYGDYDVDGITATATVYGFIKQRYPTVRFYIPDRYTEGYGLSSQAIAWAAQVGIQLIIALDCGIKAFDCIQQARQAGIDVIVCDHHEPADVLPAAYAILDPKQPDCPYPFKELSGCALGFKLLQAWVLEDNLPEEMLYAYLDLVAISTACDLVPMVDENRILVYHGLNKLNTDPNLGLHALAQTANLAFPIQASALAFSLGPRLNAAGRIAHGSLAVRLLLADEKRIARALASNLNHKNELRQSLDRQITTEALGMIAQHTQATQAKATVLFNAHWHKGVIGIVASRCLEEYYRPTIILTAAADGKATGSARSVVGFNIYRALVACQDLLDQYGGHAHAAGLTLPRENIPLFQERFEEVVQHSIDDQLLTPVQRIDLPLSLARIDAGLYNILKQMGPFGNGNMRFVFATDAVIAASYSVLKNKHLKLTVHQAGTPHRWKAIGFGLARRASMVSDQRPFRMVYTVEEHSYRGECGLRIRIKDIQPGDTA